MARIVFLYDLLSADATIRSLLLVYMPLYIEGIYLQDRENIFSGKSGEVCWKGKHLFRTTIFKRCARVERSCAYIWRACISRACVWRSYEIPSLQRTDFISDNLKHSNVNFVSPNRLILSVRYAKLVNFYHSYPLFLVNSKQRNKNRIWRKLESKKLLLLTLLDYPNDVLGFLVQGIFEWFLIRWRFFLSDETCSSFLLSFLNIARESNANLTW